MSDYKMQCLELALASLKASRSSWTAEDVISEARKLIAFVEGQ